MTKPTHDQIQTFLDKVKSRKTGDSNFPRYELVAPNWSSEMSLTELKSQWVRYAQGDPYFNNLSKQESVILKDCVGKGDVIPTFQERIDPHRNGTKLLHFSDVNWARNAQNQLVFYRLSQNPNQPDGQDQCAVLGNEFSKAMDTVVHHLKMGSAIEDDRITLKSGEVITPIIMGYRNVEIRQRQRGILPDQLEKGLKEIAPFVT